MITIAQGKSSDYKIVIRENASLSENTAAEELKKYIGIITGADIEITKDTACEAECEISIGFTNRNCGETEDKLASLGDEGYIIKAYGKKLFILGSEIRGAIYGVYTFLEKFASCRFYTNDFEVIPTADSISVSDDAYICEIPQFEYRNSYWFSQTDEFISVKLKNNGGMGHHLTERVGGGIDYIGDYCHTIGYLAGLCEKGEAWWDNPCFTDEDVYKLTLENVKQELRENPDKKIISVSQLDGNNGECKCDRCRKVAEAEESNAATLLNFCNRIQEDIKDEFPDVQIDTLAYRYSRKPPKNLKAHKDLIVRLCNIECCFRHPLDECSDAPAHSVEDHFVNNLKKWSELTNHLYIWDYTTNFTNLPIPFPNFEALRKNIRFFVENNVTGIFEQGNIASLNGEFGELRGYILCKLMWNPYMSEEEYQALIMQFMNDFYGAGAQFIKEYFDLEHACSKNAHFGVYFDDASHYIYMPGYDTPLDGAFAFYDRATELFEKAEAAAANDEKALANIRRSRVQLLDYHYFILRKKTDLLEDGPEKDAVENEIVESNKYQFALMRDYGVISNREFNKLDFSKEPDWHKNSLTW